MTYRIEISRRAEKGLQAIPSPDRERIGRRIDSLALDPYPPGSLKLVGTTDTFRIRSGDYRVVYQIKKDVLLVLVIRIGHRRDIYR